MSDEIVTCTRCEGLDIEYLKSWTFKSGRSEVEVNVDLYYCNDCKKSFRVNRRV